jgi:hypothetical protein
MDVKSGELGPSEGSIPICHEKKGDYAPNITTVCDREDAGRDEEEGDGEIILIS